MPATSGKQFRAMQAAAHGRGQLGIPPSVAREFIEETPPEKRSKFSKKRKRRSRHSATFDRLMNIGKRG